MTVLSVLPRVQAETIDDAYRAELTRLKAEEAAIRNALKREQTKQNSAVNKLETEIEALARTLAQLRADNAKMELQVPQAERLQSIEGQARNLDRRKKQIETWLETHQVPLPVRGTPSSVSGRHEHPPLDLMVKAALGHVEKHGQLWVREGQLYFGVDGVARHGPVLRIAEVAAVAIDEQFHPLDMATDGSLRMDAQIKPIAAKHGSARTVDAVLYDPTDLRPSPRTAGGWYAYIESGGAVMWAIAILACLAIVVFVERLIAFGLFLITLSRAERRGPDVLVPSSHPLLHPVAIIQTHDGTAEVLETAAAESMSQVQSVIRRGVSLLAVVASVSPLLGLLGTVTGMIGTFAMITDHGTGDPRLLSGGISEALLTTQFGLMVAIPALLFQTTLYRIGDAIARRVESFALSALEIRIANTPAESPKAQHEEVQSELLKVRGYLEKHCMGLRTGWMGKLRARAD